jgi:hypothetical protein
MPTIKNNFVLGKMNLDVDDRLLQKGEYRTASNIRIANSNGSDVGAIEKSLSNDKLTNLALGENIFTIGGISDEFKEKLYWLVKSDSGSYIIEYDTLLNTTSFVLKDTRLESVLAFDENFLVTGIVLVVDTDNQSRFLLFTDYNTEPKCVNIDRAKTYAENGFDLDDILLIKKPPIHAPKITLTKTESQEENNIEEKLLRFGTRFKYLDEEYSAISPLSELAFKAKRFNYDYSTSTNESMVNDFNKIEIAFNTGSKLVKEIELIFIESGKSVPYIVEKYNKANKGWGNNATVTATFTNNKIYKNLPESQLLRLFDGVPLKAKSLELINNLLVFGNYTENWNLIDNLGNKVNVNCKLDLVSTEVTLGAAYKSNKTNRDYEVGLVYGDDYGRHTTILTSENNTLHIPNSKSTTKNEIKLTIKHKPPVFAKWFRACIKQNKYEYDIIVPTLFYEDGVYRWIRLEGNDQDKIKEGSVILVKSDSQGSLNTPIYTKVLEIKNQDKNFLQPDDITDTIKEQNGLYFKIKPAGFRLYVDDYENFEIDTYHNSRRKYHDVLTNNSTGIVGLLHSYSTGLDDLTANSGSVSTLPQMTDKRFTIEIDGTNTFRWSIDEGANWVSELITISAGSPYTLSDGVQITFGSSTGYTIRDSWNIYARGKLRSNNDRAYGFFRTSGNKYNTLTDEEYITPEEKKEAEVIEAGASILLEYDEWNKSLSNESVCKFYLPLYSNAKYDNIQEWYYKENIGAQILLKKPDFDLSNIYFMRGVIKKDRDGNANYLDYNADGFMTMVIQSKTSQGSLSWVYVSAKTTLFQSNGESRVLFETVQKEVNSDIFFEIGRTYPIVNGFHTSTESGDSNQTVSTDAVLMLPTYNCIGWGNGFESIKIKDLLNANSISIQTKPNAAIENYRENNKIASLTYSQPYSQSLNYNGLNEFNLSQNNSKDLDDRFGSIQAVKEYNGNLDVFQEDKVSSVLYGQTVLYNQDGTSNIAKSDLILDGVQPYAGEFGISTSPESLVAFGNYRYWADEKRGVWLRKGQSGIEIISQNGLKDWFRDYFRNNPKSKNLSCCDPFYGQLTLGLNGNTLTFDEKVLGFTSFHSFIPDWMLRLNNDFYSIKNGQLYKHNVEGSFNNFYDTQFKSEVKTIFNDESSLDKIYKTLVLESSGSWKATLKTNYTESHIKSNEFNQRESRWFAYMRKNEAETDLHSATQGIGEIQDISGLEIEFGAIPDNVSVGDVLYQIRLGNKEIIGEITNIQNNTITVDALTNTPEFDAFCFSKKDPRIEGGDMRGYYLEVTLDDESLGQNELFGVSSEVVKSYL